MAVRQNHKHKTTLVAYMLVTFGFTWGSWSALVAGSISSGGHYGTNWLFVLGTFGPLLGGAAAIWVGGGRALIFPWVKRIGRIDRRSAYAAALAACGVLAMWAGQLIAVRADPDPAAKSLPMSWATVFALAGWMAMAAGEEAGWRGWLGPFLMRRLGAVGSSLATGAVWTLWHVP
ncbi:MAG: CPBP family intramembrane metalloprotease, partial [Bifidobacteriaceae bacterium]|nr:CPBP family intramembrane metalloprotease [Bifidobacteriaceae bacterium]